MLKSDPNDNSRVWLEEYTGGALPDHPSEATSRFFMHLWEPTSQSYKYSPDEMQKMGRYDSLDYEEPHNFVFREHLSAHVGEGKYARWFVYGLIGVTVGLWGFIMFTSIETIFQYRRMLLENWITESYRTILYVGLISGGMALASAGVCIVVPAAAGSGVPEVMAYLNGVMFPRVFNIRTLLVKSLSTVLSVCSGLPVGAEGPMIHIGSLIAAGVSSGRSRSLKCSSTRLSQFRNTKDAREFVTAGAAAGITFVFRAPIGGLLFVMEEVASFLPVHLAWMVFFSCLCSSFSAYLFSTYFHTWREVEPTSGVIGEIPFSARVGFGMVTNVPVNSFAVVPAMVVGLVGGVMATLFTISNLSFVKLRNKLVVKSSFRRVIEPCLVAFLFTTIVFGIARNYHCHPIRPFHHGGQAPSMEVSLFTAGCKNGTHNPFASISLVAGMDSITTLFNTEAETFDAASLGIFLALYFLFGIISFGMSLSHGVLVPSLMMGSLMGRLVGLLVYEASKEKDVFQWATPAMFAVIGAGAFFSGLSRLTFSLTIIILELTNDLEHLVSVMVAIWTAKAVADAFCTPFIHGVLRAKCVPFLDTDLRKEKFDMHSVREIMTHPVVSISHIERIEDIIHILISTSHHGFPVLSGSGKIRGLITRDQLEELLWFIVLTSTRNEEGNVVNEHSPPTYEELKEVREKIFWTRSLSAARHPMLQPLRNQAMDLNPYVDTSAVVVPETMSISRTYLMFRSLNLRHMVVGDSNNEPIGIITRVDLVESVIESKLLQQQEVVTGTRRNLTPGTSPMAGDRHPMLFRKASGLSAPDMTLSTPTERDTRKRAGSLSQMIYSRTLVVPHSPSTRNPTQSSAAFVGSPSNRPQIQSS